MNSTKVLVMNVAPPQACIYTSNNGVKYQITTYTDLISSPNGGAMYRYRTKTILV